MGSVLDTITSAATLPIAAAKDAYTMAKTRSFLDEDESETLKTVNDILRSSRPEKGK